MTFSFSPERHLSGMVRKLMDVTSSIDPLAIGCSQVADSCIPASSLLTHLFEQTPNGGSRGGADVYGLVDSVGHYSRASLAGDNLQDEAANVCAIKTKVPPPFTGAGHV